VLTPIEDEEFARLYGIVDEACVKLVAAGELPISPSFFERVTAVAYLYFARESAPADVMVLEVGMGGRLDATNVVEPLVSVITDISLDHQKYLGDTVAEIAREKVGIIRPGGVVVTLPQQPEANDVIGNTVMELGARGVNAVPYVPPVSPGSFGYLGKNLFNAEDAEKGRLGHLYRYPLEVMGREILVETGLVGRHQLRNVALAIAAAVELSEKFPGITAASIERGIRETRWPGRFQQVTIAGWPEIVLDVAHNPAGAWALRSALSERYPDRRLIFVFGAMRDKAIAEMTEILFPLAESVVVTRAENPRSASPEEIRAAASRTSVEMVSAADVEAALAAAKMLAGPDAVVVITGSIYLVGEAMRFFGQSCAPHARSLAPPEERLRSG
jgi:dihydrofolate synthase/folylpolyglutamate synthase